MTTWQTLIPEVNGELPGGKPLRRTGPSGACEAGIAFLGVYPAATEVKPLSVGGTRLNLPTEVEHESFAAGSRSGREFEERYLLALGVERRDVLVTDMFPYYLANTTTSASRKAEDGERADAAPPRSMADNIRTYERATGVVTGIQPRPPPAALVKLAEDLPGNADRLRALFEQHAPRLLLTLGTEAAAFVRGRGFEEARALGDALFYCPPRRQTFAGLELEVVHLVHPHLFIKQVAKWTSRHRDWCAGPGRRLVGERLAARPKA